ncbi:helix-turn-helix transcriptional regulator [Streptomyces sp. P38-E01]|uniref:Helix-turn-helix transcriptional regulator n=1 Tax=Streptomyces tardus TaxID=2780544 RepID=A0A949JCQ3_9ACTN|nr:helix-turn-helix transcriptional regulator [Streptomyces tardus]MBU7596608.1 helix-turn-helix transcriptional regulator [Streptomyces tardus]
MPPRTTTTARQRRLGYELRKLRQRAGLSATEAGKQLGLDQSRISNIEAARFGISADRVRTFAYNYGCADSGYVDALAAMTTSRRKDWWDEYASTLPSGLLDLAETEHHASAIETAQTTHLPGLLQTVDYARSVFRQSIPNLPPPQVEFRVSHRIKRQDLLYRNVPVAYRAVIHEAALRMQFGGADVTREQLAHILDMSEREHITILVIPFTAGAFPGAGQSVLYAHGPVPQLDTVQLDSEHGSLFLEAEGQLEKYRTFMREFESVAVDDHASRSIIRRVIESL